jgi:surface polysaccharide O-acyltransferase-like enzyme
MENTAPRWLLWASIALLLWNMIGVGTFASAMMTTPADMAALPKDQQLLWSQMPDWGWAAYGVATIGGLIGALGLLLKKKWAALVTLLSIAGIFFNFLPTFAMSKGVDVWQPQFYAFPLFILAVALLQYWLARKANSNGWAS